MPTVLTLEIFKEFLKCNYETLKKDFLPFKVIKYSFNWQPVKKSKEKLKN